jgi:hypothetical protein
MNGLRVSLVCGSREIPTIALDKRIDCTDLRCRRVRLRGFNRLV